MTTLTKATIGNAVPLFIRDVLRQNLTDPSSRSSPSSWIFKSNPTKDDLTATKSPRVVITLEDSRNRNIDMAGSKYINESMSIEIEVVSTKIVDRDTVSDQIISVLQVQTSTDGTNTIRSQHIKLKDISQMNDDEYTGSIPEIIYRKIIRATFSYYGT